MSQINGVAKIVMQVFRVHIEQPVGEPEVCEEFGQLVMESAHCRELLLSDAKAFKLTSERAGSLSRRFKHRLLRLGAQRLKVSFCLIHGGGWQDRRELLW